MILTREAILAARKEGHIVIDPFEESLVSVNSVDVRLGREMWTLKNTSNLRDPYVAQDNLWECVEPKTVSYVRKYLKPSFADGVLLPSDEVFLLSPGGFYLGTTLESIGTAHIPGSDKSVVAEMKAKSTFGRLGLTTALCAGLGDVGYTSQWALEIRVVSAGTIAVAVGTPVAQVVFYEGYPTDAKYEGPGRYQDGKDVRFLPKPLRVVRSKK